MTLIDWHELALFEDWRPEEVSSIVDAITAERHVAEGEVVCGPAGAELVTTSQLRNDKGIGIGLTWVELFEERVGSALRGGCHAVVADVPAKQRTAHGGQSKTHVGDGRWLRTLRTDGQLTGGPC